MCVIQSYLQEVVHGADVSLSILDRHMTEVEVGELCGHKVHQLLQQVGRTLGVQAVEVQHVSAGRLVVALAGVTQLQGELCGGGGR